MKDKILQHVADSIGTAVNEGSEIEALGFDSLDLLEFLQWIESEFGVLFAQQSIGKFNTLGDIIAYAESDAARILYEASIN